MRRISRADFEQRPWLLDEADPLTRLLFLQHDVITVRQALQHMSRGALRHRVDSGRWQPVHRGIVVAHDGPIGDEQRLWIATLAAGKGTVVGGRTALAMQGMKGFASSLIHLVVPAGRRERDAPVGVAVHRSTCLPAQDIRAALRPMCTTIERSVVDAASWARTDDEARTVIAMVFQQRLATLDGITTVLKRMVRARRRRLIIQCAQDAAGGSQSLGELKILQLLRAAGLPEPSRQKVRTDASGRRRYLDLYFDDYRLHIEIDGGHHSTRGRRGSTWTARTTSTAPTTGCCGCRCGSCATDRRTPSPASGRPSSPPAGARRSWSRMATIATTRDQGLRR